MDAYVLRSGQEVDDVLRHNTQHEAAKALSSPVASWHKALVNEGARSGLVVVE